MDGERVVVGHIRAVGGVAPAGYFLLIDAEFAGRLGVAVGGVGGRAQILLCHQVGVDVVVCDGAVLVRAGDSVDAEPASTVVVSQAVPQPGGVHQQGDTYRVFEHFVAGGPQVADNRVSDVCVDVESGRTGRPVG